MANWFTQEKDAYAEEISLIAYSELKPGLN